MIDITKVNENHNIYIIKSGDNVKLGFSSQILKRLASYNGANPDVELVKSGFVPDGLKFEQDFHKDRPAKYAREWYDIKEKDDLLEALDSSSILIGGESTIENIEIFSTLADITKTRPEWNVGELSWSVSNITYEIGVAQCTTGEEDATARFFIYNQRERKLLWGDVAEGECKWDRYYDRDTRFRYTLQSFTISKQFVLIIETATPHTVFEIYFNDNARKIEKAFETNVHLYK